MTGMLVSLLEARAAGETREIAAPNQEMELQGALIGAIAEATGLDQQQIRTQTREGKTLLEIAEANGADVDEILAQVVTAETERVNQAVADGSLEQAEADQFPRLGFGPRASRRVARAKARGRRCVKSCPAWLRVANMCILMVNASYSR